MAVRSSSGDAPVAEEHHAAPHSESRPRSQLPHLPSNGVIGGARRGPRRPCVPGEPPERWAWGAAAQVGALPGRKLLGLFLLSCEVSWVLRLRPASGGRVDCCMCWLMQGSA